MRDAPYRCNREQPGGELRHIRNILAISSLVLCQFLLTARRISIARLGMADFAG
jgi:hypothetical protein